MKGFHIVVKAIESILSEFNDLCFVFAGPDFGRKDRGEDFAGELFRLNQIYDGRVIYLGFVKRLFLPSIIQGAFACVMPSRFDNLPNACIEAMSYGKVVIGTRGASFEQLIIDNYSGLLVERESVTDLEKTIKYLLDMSDADRNEMGFNAKKAVERLAPDRIYPIMETYYRRVIEEFWNKKKA